MSAVPVFPPPHLVPSPSADDGQPPSTEAAPAPSSSASDGRPHVLGALPAPPPDAPQISTATGTPSQLNVASSDASTLKFDALGPLVVNSDGTLSRIHNWASMTQGERERTLRVLGKRNQLRIADLQGKEGEDAIEE
ncbi:hypothetical protein OC834_006619 [Tilletia horrida]|nr:hypothetical protein OC834_006619 [Tilletia horrida]